MNKSLLTLGLLAAITTGADAQAVLGYTPEVTAGTYTPLTDATVIYDGSTADEANKGEDLGTTIITSSGIAGSGDIEADGYSVGFSYPLAGQEMSKFVVSGAGWVSFGTDKITVNSHAQSNFLTFENLGSAAGCASFYGVIGTDDTRISYQTIGNGNDAVLVVQFENYNVMSTMFDDTGIPVNMQLRFYANGDWSVVYSGFSEMDSSVTFRFRCGVRLGDACKCAYNTLSELLTDNNQYENLNLTNSVTDGTTLTFRTPEDCVTPSSGATDLTFTSTSTQIDGSFTASADADTYLVIYTCKDNLDWTPQDGTIYGTETAEDYTVVQYGPDTEFVCYDLAGGTNYNYRVYAVNSYGLNGPKYNTANVLTGSVSTKPAAPSAQVKSVDKSSIAISVEANEADDDVVVLLTSYCLQDSYGDKGLFGALTTESKVGDVLAVPEDFNTNIPDSIKAAPVNGGKVVYVGKASDNIVLDGLDNSTLYYMAVYSRNADGVYSTDCVDMDAFTVILAPYDGNSINFPRYRLPGGWSTTEGEGVTGFRDESFFNFRTGITQGTQLIQQRMQVSKGNATDGIERWMTLSPIEVNGRHLIARFDYYMTESLSYFGSNPYNSWADGDELEILVSKDNGITWESVKKYTKDENPQQEENFSVVSIEADLNAFRNETVLVRLRWKTYNNVTFGTNMYVDRFSLQPGDFPAVPEVTIGTVGYDTAVVSWISAQNDYELAYREKTAEGYTTVKVEGANTYKLTGLVPVTEYEVKVRGILEGENQYSEWSDPVTFTTLDWPAVAAPEDLTSNVDGFDDGQKVILSWKGTEEMVCYKVSYRKSSDTTWTDVECNEPTVTLTGLDYETRYIWKVLANCTHDRVTEYSAQANFETPADYSGIANVIADCADAEIYTLTGIRVRNTGNLPAGIYIIRMNGRSLKVSVR